MTTRRIVAQTASSSWPCRCRPGQSGGGAGAGLVAAAPATARVTGPGVISTVAGGPGRGQAPAVAQDVGAVAAGPAGDVYVGDSRAWYAG